MSFSWPQFANEALDGGRTWSATFDSYDERKDTVYYMVTLSEGASLMAAVSAAFPDDAWNEPVVRSTLCARIGNVAATGQTNTSYRGPVLRL
jgi:hypothetical protein